MTDDTPQVEIIHASDALGRGGLYNALFPGGFERGDLLLPVIGLNTRGVNRMRFRDAWVEKTPLGILEIRVYTRIGGGNREDYAEAIATLQGSPHYLRDADDGFDSTYASFWFRVPDDTDATLYETLRGMAVDPVDVDARWKKAIADLEAPENAERTRKIGEQMFGDRLNRIFGEPQ